MEHTVKLFYEDVFQAEFTATVLSCEPDKDGYKAVLDRTAFFPEGGGQYGDRGYLNDVRVLDTREQAGKIYHFLERPVPVGSAVKGKLDWDKRFDKMQQHTGEHIVSGIVHEKFGYDNVGFHLADEYCTMDFNGMLSHEQLLEIEEEANRVVFQNLPVEVLYPDKGELASLSYRSKIEVEGQLRLVKIAEVDCCACCAPHVAYTGQIGLIKLVSMTNYKGGERICMLAGARALRDYQKKQQLVKRVGMLLCEKEEGIAGAVERLKEGQSSLKEQIGMLRRERLCRRAEEIAVSGKRVCVFEEGLPAEELRELANLLMDRGAEVCGVFEGNEKEGYRYVISSRTEDVRVMNQMLREKFGARGGGRPEMVQGSLRGTENEIKALF